MALVQASSIVLKELDKGHPLSPYIFCHDDGILVYQYGHSSTLREHCYCKESETRLSLTFSLLTICSCSDPKLNHYNANKFAYFIVCITYAK